MLEVAPGPLMRTHTAPVHARSLSQARSGMSLRTHAAVRTPYPASVPSLAPPTDPSASRPGTAQSGRREGATSAIPPEPGNVVPTDNIINQLADSSKSLYQICVKLRQRLAEVPGFRPHLDAMEQEEADDPMTAMWRCLKKGYPLLTIYNALQPATPIEIDPGKVSEAKRPKDAAFKFSEACKTHLHFPPEECFLIKDLHGDDTTGFVKVIAAVNRVLDLLQERDLLLQPEIDHAVTAPEANKKRTHRDYVVAELVDTERKYVQDLEALQQFKLALQQKGEVTGDKIHAIFLNLNALLDFQRRFLIRIETTNSLPEAQQNWGQLFIQSQASFRVYEPYMANQRHADEQALLEFDKLQRVGHQITCDRTTLSGFLLKPFQRLVKYPMLLKQLRDKCEAEDHIRDDLSAGIAAASSILERANAAIDKEERQQAVEELFGQVDDWKGHSPSGFGELLLSGDFTVIKTDSRTDQEKEYKVFLFEKILLCCSELNSNKPKNTFIGMNRPATDKKAHRIRMQLKGRIFMQNVTETLTLQKPGSYSMQIFWKGDPGVENFVIRYNSEEVMKKWYAQVNAQRKLYADKQASSHGSMYTASSVTSDTDFSWVQAQAANVPNPYQQDDEGDDEDEADGDGDGDGSPPRGSAAGIRPPPLAVTRHASHASLRSRPTTGEGGPAMPPMGTRMPPPRFPMGTMAAPPLTLHTQLPSGAPSPAERAAASYFSPTSESPGSVRGSSSSGLFSFPRQTAPPSHWPADDHNRFTAPPMTRTGSREASAPAHAHPTNGRTAPRPSITGLGGSQASFAQNRLRSASSPDIHQHGPPSRPPPIPDMPVPPFPAQAALGTQPINRSHSSSPPDAAHVLPIRAHTPSAAALRERLAPAPAGYAAHARPGEGRLVPPPLKLSGDGHRLAGSPSMMSPPPTDPPPTPTQLKVKVSFDGNYVTLVVGTNISYQSLVDRIDAKLSRFTALAIGRGTIRLRYQDEDGDYVTIRSDEDIQMALSDWKEQQRSQLTQGQLGEIHLFCQTIES
ncbi:MAG: hypothetical protein M1826_000720 [Phylliscum demangeonii]|nr:MAG: hypothetical protein M1826_000720 [Phylliscum demangeonii]